HREADCTAVGMVGRLAINGFGHHKTPAIVCVRQPASGVLSARLTAHRDKQRIVEFLRPADVVTPDHHMAEHSVLSSSIRCARRLSPTSRTRFTGRVQYDGTMLGKRVKSLPPYCHPSRL